MHCCKLCNKTWSATQPSNETKAKASTPEELALIVHISKVHSEALLISRHCDFKHPCCGVEPLRSPLDPRGGLIVSNQSPGVLAQITCGTSTTKLPQFSIVSVAGCWTTHMGSPKFLPLEASRHHKTPCKGYCLNNAANG